MPVIGEPCYEAGVQPSIVFRVTPKPISPLNECTDCEVRVKDPTDTLVGTYASPDPSLSKETHLEMVQHTPDSPAIETRITEWTFTFPDALELGSDRTPWKVQFRGTGGVVARLTTTHMVGRDTFA